MFRKSAELHRKQAGKALSVQTNRRSRGLSSEMNMKGEGFKDLLKIGKRLDKKYGKMAKAVGADKEVKKNVKKSLPTIEQKLKKVGISDKVIKPISKEVNKVLGGSMSNKYGLPQDAYKSAIDRPFEIYGTGWFDDLISTLAVLPIPGVSCMARTVAIVKTAVDTATSDEPTKAFGGVVSDIADTVDKIAPPGIKEITTPGKALLESVGFGMMKPSDREQIVKTGVKHLNSLLDNIKVENLPREKANQVLVAKKTVAQALPKLRELRGKGFLDGKMHYPLPPTYTTFPKNDNLLKLEEKRLKRLKEKQKKKLGFGGSWKEDIRDAIEYKKCRNKGFNYYDTRRKKCYNKSSDLYKK